MSDTRDFTSRRRHERKLQVAEMKKRDAEFKQMRLERQLESLPRRRQLVGAEQGARQEGEGARLSGLDLQPGL